jgi:hypothetical protein
VVLSQIFLTPLAKSALRAGINAVDRPPSGRYQRDGIRIEVGSSSTLSIQLSLPDAGTLTPALRRQDSGFQASSSGRVDSVDRERRNRNGAEIIATDSSYRGSRPHL